MIQQYRVKIFRQFKSNIDHRANYKEGYFYSIMLYKSRCENIQKMFQQMIMQLIIAQLNHRKKGQYYDQEVLLQDSLNIVFYHYFQQPCVSFQSQQKLSPPIPQQYLMNSGLYPQPQKPQAYGIEYKGTTLRLGTTWPDILKNIDFQIPDKRMAASLKLCLFERLKSSLKLSPSEVEPLLQQYADSL